MQTKKLPHQGKEPPILPATISVEDRVLASGGYELDRLCSEGMFWPSNSITLKIPIPKAVLHIPSAGKTFLLENLRQDPVSPFRWNFEVTSEQEAKGAHSLGSP